MSKQNNGIIHVFIMMTSSNEIFSRYWPFVRWINKFTKKNNGETGDLRRRRAHYDVPVMIDMHYVSSQLSTSVCKLWMGYYMIYCVTK